MKLALTALLASCCLATAAVTEELFVHAGTKFRVVRLAPEQVTIVWKDKDGAPYRNFESVQAAFAKQDKKINFIMNGGIFEPGGIPSGLHVEDRKTLQPLNLADAPGNFFLKPNGVFSIRGADKRTASISTSETFRKLDQQREGSDLQPLELAIQSGPMLLIAGKRHPAFNENSVSKLHRNGVGVDQQGRVVFAITAKGETVNLWNFAGLFLALDCNNALFLDGDISRMTVNPTGQDPSNAFGAIFVVTE